MTAGPRAQIEIPDEKIRDFCGRHHVCRFALFGSVLRADFAPGSDVDVLVEFDPRYVPGLGFIAMEDELTRMFGLMAELLAPEGPPSGEMRLSQWLASNRERVGTQYASEVARHFRPEELDTR